MKRILPSLLVAAVLCGISTLNASAADKTEKKKARADAALNAALKKFDKNNDGKLDADELAELTKDSEQLKRFDKNANGKIDDDEKAAIETALKGDVKKKKKNTN